MHTAPAYGKRTVQILELSCSEACPGEQEGMKQQSASIQELKAELGTGLLAQLSSAERGELSALNGRLQQLQADESAAEQHLLEAQV